MGTARWQISFFSGKDAFASSAVPLGHHHNSIRPPRKSPDPHLLFVLFALVAQNLIWRHAASTRFAIAVRTRGKKKELEDFAKQFKHGFKSVSVSSMR